jgi:hypothetical protein
LTRSAQPPTFMIVPPHSRSWLLVAGLMALPTITTLHLSQLAAQAATPQPVAAFRLVVAPISLRIPVGGTAPVRVTAYDAKGSVIPRDSYQPTFKLADSTVVAVDSRGVVTGLKSGSTQLTVQVNDLLRDVLITVGRTSDVTAAGAAASGKPVALEIAPNPILLLPTERAHPTVTVVKGDGSRETLSTANFSVFGREAVFDSVSGDIVGLSPGDAVLGVRTADGASVSVPINVAPVAIEFGHDTLLLEENIDDTIPVNVPAQHGRRLAHGFSWHSDNPDVVRVLNPVQGIVRGGAVGMSGVIADGYGMSKHIPVRVHRHVDFVRFRPDPSAPLRLAVGAFANVTADQLGADSARIMALPPAWTVADSSIATYDAQSHRLIGRHVGRTTLECRVRGFGTTVWPVDIADGTLAIDRGPRRTITLGAAAKVAASYRDAQRQPIGRPAMAKWTSSDDAVVSVDSDGTLISHRVGHAVITLVANAGVRDSMLVFVSGDLLATRRIGERRAELVTLPVDNPKPVALGDTSQFTRDGAWSPDHTRIAYVSDAGTHGDKWAVYIADADGGHARPITPLGDGYEHPAWSPDAASIVVSAGKMGHRLTLVTVRADSETQMPKPVGRDRLSWRWPAYDSGGSSIIALGERGDERHLYRVHAADEIAITTGQGAHSHPIVLADGAILYLADSRVMQIPAGGGQPSIVFDALPGITELAASADGRRIVVGIAQTETVSGQKRKRSTLYLITRGSSAQPIKLSTGADDLSDPAW